MIVDSAVYRDGTRQDVDCHTHDFPALREAARDGGFVWVGLYQPSASELDEVAEAFGVGRWAVEHAVTSHSRPKLVVRDDGITLVLRTLWYIDAEDAVETGEITLFVGDDYVVSVRRGRGSELKTARKRLESHHQVLSHGPSAVVYAICASVVRAFAEVADDLETDVDEVEASVFSERRTSDSRRIYQLKREVAEARRAVLPLRDPLRQFSVGDVDLIGTDHKSQALFRQTLDDLTQVGEIVDNLDQLLSTAFDAHLASISVQQNDDMRKISAGAAIVVVPTLIAGVYGMNFEHMPELAWRFGYAYAVVLMAAVAGGLYWWFKRSGWL